MNETKRILYVIERSNHGKGDFFLPDMHVYASRNEPYLVFKSTPENWMKERSGRKPNTLRKQDLTDARFHIRPGELLAIQNTETGEVFERQVTDVTHWEGWTIFSWRHPK